MSKSEKTRAERASDLLSFYSVKELADSMNVSTRTVKRWATGESQPSNENFKKVKRREYYWKGGERAKTVKSSFRDTPKTVNEGGGFSAFDLIRRIESGNFDVSELDGNKFIDFKTFVGTSGENLEPRLYTFVNPNEGLIEEGDLISFLYRTFRENEDAFNGSDVIVEIDQVQI